MNNKIKLNARPWFFVEKWYSYDIDDCLETHFNWLDLKEMFPEYCMFDTIVNHMNTVINSDWELITLVQYDIFWIKL